ncbi:UNVERIFIED_CONTAM: hypothetical protein GTU68_023874 [Idotea baltica]|nr:hypothetical protein [Idotea baltica]
MLFSLGRLWRTPFASLMTVAVIGIALALPAGLLVLLQNVNQVSGEWDDASQISLFLEQGLTEKQIRQVQNKIKSWPTVGKTSYQTAAQSLTEFRELSGLGSLLDSLPDNPLPAVITLFPAEENASDADIQLLLKDLTALPDVVQAQLDMAWLQRLRSINKLLERGISLLGLLLSLSVLLVIGNTIRLAILNRQSEIKVMKLVGATDRFIRRPFLYTGFWYGFVGGLFAWGTLIFVLNMLTTPVHNLVSHYGSEFDLHWFSGVLLLYLPLVGILLGILGAWLAVGRHLHAIEPN